MWVGRSSPISQRFRVQSASCDQASHQARRVGGWQWPHGFGGSRYRAGRQLCRSKTGLPTPPASSRGVNTLLPESIVITNAVEAPDGFHAIRDSIGKRYRYQLQLGGVRDAFAYRYHWRVKYAVEIDRMRQATKHFLGEQDFASFQGAGSVRLTTVRDVRACDLTIDKAASDGTPRISIEVEAGGFLYNMVRNIVGTIVEVGRGKYPPEWIDEIIEAKNRDIAVPTAPPQGLFLKRVDYAPFE